MKICLVLKWGFNKLPPVMSLCEYLCDMGYSIDVVCDDITESSKKHFEARNVNIHQLHSAFKGFGKIGTIISWLRFRCRAWKKIDEISPDLLWICSADTAIALGKKLISQRFVMHIHELYCEYPMYRKMLREPLQNAVGVIVSEKTRAHIFRAWFQLRETPTVMPNKPYEHPRKRNLPISDPAAAEAFAKIPAGSKIVFYQGGVGDRRDLKPVAKAIEELGAPWVLAVQCPVADNEYYRDFFSNYKFYHIPYVPAPLHLEITSNVDFGIVTYSHVSMNNEFCAPNKIWEYSGFSLPMFANDVLGLEETVGQYNAGLCVNLDQMSIAEIKEKLQFMLQNEENFKQNAEALYESCNNGETLKYALKKWGINNG